METHELPTAGILITCLGYLTVLMFFNLIDLYFIPYKFIVKGFN